MRPRHALARLLRVLASGLKFLMLPARRLRRRCPPRIQAWRGYGTPRGVYVVGRVQEDTGLEPVHRSRGFWGNLATIWRRLASRGLPRPRVWLSFEGVEREVIGDLDGYFEAELPARPPVAPMWQGVRLALRGPGGEPLAEAIAPILVPPPGARFMVVSDIDDTVIQTGVAHKLQAFWELFAKGAEAREAFPGIGAFYRALHRGTGGSERNPILYVSRSPWSIYGVLDTFFRTHEIPVGPVMLLRDWGITLRRPWPRRAIHHKRDLIERIFRTWPDQTFILVGDSGQQDPEVYLSLVRQHPGRVAAVYIRNVSRGLERPRVIQALAEDLSAGGAALVLADDTLDMAHHAAARGWIPREAVVEVAADRGIPPRRRAEPVVVEGDQPEDRP